MTLSIIIVNYNGRQVLPNCVQSLVRDRPATEHEVIVVDNGSNDGSADMVAARWPWVKLIRLPGNVGFAAGNNAGIRASAGDLILLLNSDTIVPPDAIDRLVSALVDHPDAAVAGPRLIDGEGRAELSFASGPEARLPLGSWLRPFSASI